METLNRIQKELKAPKGQHNSFGNYNYRSCEDILEALKPLLGKATLTLNDEIVLIGDRYYVKATATLNEGEKSVSASAFARECLERKGMDASQITGATSSYARKYALNGLFCIDDTKDADTIHNGNGMVEYISDKERSELLDMAVDSGADMPKFLKYLGVEDLSKLPKIALAKAKQALTTKKSQKKV